jgi:hypothetical protein
MLLIIKAYSAKNNFKSPSSSVLKEIGEVERQTDPNKEK